MVVPVKLTKRQILSKFAGIFDPIGAGAKNRYATTLADWPRLG